MKNLFDKAKTTETKKPVTKTNDKVRVKPEDLHQEELFEMLSELEELKKKEKTIQAKMGMINGEVKEVGIVEFLKLYNKTGKYPGSFMLESKSGEDTAQVMFVPTDRYIKVNEEQSNELKEEFSDDIVTEDTSYGFNKKLLEKYGDKISEAIMGTDIPQKDKEKIITSTTSYSVAKGTISKMADYGDIKEVMEKIRPVMTLKGAEVIKG